MKRISLFITLVLITFTSNATNWDFTQTLTFNAGNGAYYHSKDDSSDGYIVYSDGNNNYLSIGYTFDELSGLIFNSKYQSTSTKICYYNKTSSLGIASPAKNVLTIQGLKQGQIVSIKYCRQSSSTLTAAPDFLNTSISGWTSGFNLTASTSNILPSGTNDVDAVTNTFTVNSDGDCHMYLFNTRILSLSTSDGGESTNLNKTYINNSGIELKGDVLVNDDNLDVTVFNIAGAKVISSSAASINVSSLKGSFVAVTTNGSYKFAK